MIIIPEQISLMTAVLAGECPHCSHWVGRIVKEYNSPEDALKDQDWPDLECLPLECCDPERPVWPTHFLVIYGGQILDKRLVGGDDLPVVPRDLQ